MASASSIMQPAILGGPQAVSLDDTAANRWPILGEAEEQAVLDVLRHGDLSHHPATRALEDDYRRRFGVTHALGHCNGTAALLAGFFAIGLKPGDEVLVPSATHWASVVPMLQVGAIPVFCESDTERLGIDPADAESRVTPRTKAIVVVHLLGMPSKMTELLALARRHDLRVIEDASHAHGATWRGRPCGTLGDVSIFSLQTIKLAPAGEGGMFLTNSDEYYERAVCLGDPVRILELESPAKRFAGTGFGLKTRLAPICAAIARVQLERLDENNARRRENILILAEKLETLGFDTFRAPAHCERVYFEFFIRYDEAKSGLPMEPLIAALQAEGVKVFHPRYPLLHQQPLFTEGRYAEIAGLAGRTDVSIRTYDPNDFQRTRDGLRQLLRLPPFPSASRELLDQYALAFEKVMQHADEIAGATNKALKTGAAKG